MNPPRLFPQADDPAPRRLRGREMHVGQLRQGVAYLVIDGALAHFAAFDMGDRNAQRQCRRGGSQHLIAIGNEEQKMGPPGSQRIRQAQNRHADRFGHARIAIGTQQALNPGLDGKPIALDLALIRRSVEQLAADLKDLAAKQEQIAHDTATLQAVERDLRQNISSVPPPGAVQIPRPKPTQPSAQSLATH